MGKEKKIFFENLDGLRFLSFLSVFLFHSFYTQNPDIESGATYSFFKDRLFVNGNLGVNFFFVLSGFLITYLLIEERIKTGKISVIKFWIRRILRIWPLFYLSVAIGFVAFPLLKSYLGLPVNETANVEYYLTFLNNFDFIIEGYPDASILSVLWSVAIEEQFYLLWPLLLFAIPVKRYWILFVAVIVSAITFRAVMDSELLNEHHTLSCIGDMSMGALGAWLIRKERILLFFRSLSRLTIGALYISFAVIYLYRQELFFDNYILRVIERPLIALIIISIILEQNYAKNSFFKMGNFKHLSRLGVISYGLYCLHFIGILITVQLMQKFNLDEFVWQVVILETVISLAITILISKVSYRILEKPFLRIKEKFSAIKSGHQLDR